MNIIVCDTSTITAALGVNDFFFVRSARLHLSASGICCSWHPSAKQIVSCHRNAVRRKTARARSAFYLNRVCDCVFVRVACTKNSFTPANAYVLYTQWQYIVIFSSPPSPCTAIFSHMLSIAFTNANTKINTNHSNTHDFAFNSNVNDIGAFTQYMCSGSSHCVRHSFASTTWTNILAQKWYSDTVNRVDLQQLSIQARTHSPRALMEQAPTSMTDPKSNHVSRYHDRKYAAFHGAHAFLWCVIQCMLHMRIMWRLP